VNCSQYMASSGHACRDLVLCSQGDDSSSGDDSVESMTSDMDLKGKTRVGRPRRASAQSTADMMREKTRRGSRFRLESRTDIQEAVLWLEGDAGDRDALSQLGLKDRDVELSQVTEEDEENNEVQSGEKKKSCTDDPRWLPVVLFSSLLLGAAAMLTVQRRAVEKFYGQDIANYFTIFFGVLYMVTFVTMAFCCLSDPGQLDPEDGKEAPRRSHKSWQYERPLMRFDHYCRWVTNGIALRNHREFLVMLIGLQLIWVLGFLVDIGILASSWYTSRLFGLGVVVPHLIYTMTFGYFVLPIFRLHMGFVSRNELANEWKNDLFYVVHSPEHFGDQPFPVKEIEDAEIFNDLFDKFQYDRTRNPWDKGCPTNCFYFWCNPRWSGKGNW